MKTKEEAMAMSPAPTATINLDSWWNHPERHGAMFDLAASEDVKLREGEVKAIPLGIRMKLPDGYFGLVVPRSSTCLKYGIMMANSVGIIEPEYCGDSDVWGFVAYAIRDTVIAKGTRIAQFMPVPMFGDLDFDVVESMPCTDRGGYGSTGERSNGGEPSFYDRRGRKLTVGCYCRINGTDSIGIVKKLYENKERGPIVLADFTGYGEMRKRCVEVELDERPRDCDGVPIEVGDTIWVVSEDGSSVYDCSVVVVKHGRSKRAGSSSRETRERLVGLPLSVETHAPRARQLREDSGRCRYELGRLLRESPPGRKRRHRDRGARYAGRHPAPH